MRIQLLQMATPGDAERVEALLGRLRLDPVALALGRGPLGPAGQAVARAVEAVAQRGDDAVVELARTYDDPDFTAGQLRVAPQEMEQAAAELTPALRQAIARSIAQVREYQRHILPREQAPLCRDGVRLGLRFTPLDSAGLYVPGGKASYPSSLIMLAVPAQVAGVGQLIVCVPPSRYGRSQLFLAACHALGLTHVFRAGGPAAIAAMAFGTRTIPRVDKIVGPGNNYVQLAKRMVAGAVGVDGFLGPSEIVVLADGTASPAFIAADMLAQAEHNPGSCFLLTPDAALAGAVADEIARLASSIERAEAIRAALDGDSAIVVTRGMDEAIALSDRFAAEHVNVQCADADAVAARLRHAGAVFIGPWSAVAAGDYVAGPSHCLPTNTTARFSSGISVYEFLKRSGSVRYEREGLRADAPSIRALAEAEHLPAHAASVARREAP